MLPVCGLERTGEMAIRVAIARSRDDVLADLIEREVKASPALRLVAAELVDPAAAEEPLAALARDADVLIAIGGFDAECLDAIVEQDAGAVVSGILIGSDTVSMRLKKVGAQQLIDTLIALSSDRNRERSRLVEYKFFPGEGETGGAYRFVDVGPSDGRL